MAAIVATVVMGCARQPTDARSEGKVTVATSTAVLADLIRNVGGDNVEVIHLVPADRAPALYEADPRDAITLSHASVFFANGWGYEPPSVGQLLQSTSGLRVVLLADGLTVKESVIDHGDHEHRFMNPYFYMDPRLASGYVERIRVTLSEVDPEHADAYTKNAQVYQARLQELDTWITTEVGRIPEARRRLLTDHASFPYFADRYGFQGFAASYEGTAEAGPSPSQYAYLIEQVKDWGVTVAFGEVGLSPKLLQQLARDTNIKFVPGLRTSVDDAPGSATYIEMMRGNTGLIVKALS